MDTLWDLRAWRIFAETAKRGSISEAAGALGLDRPAASKLLSRLEASLGTALLDRSARPAALSPAGERLLPEALRLASVHEALLQKSCCEWREIVLGSPVNYRRIDMLAGIERLRPDFPSVRVRLVADALESTLLERRADLAIFPWAPSDPRLAVWQIAVSGTVGLAAPAYLKKHGSPQKPEDLLHGHRILLRTTAGYPVLEELHHQGGCFPLMQCELVSAGDAMNCLEMTLAGEGICFDLTIGFTQGEIQRGNLRPVLAYWHRPFWELSLVMLRDRMGDAVLCSYARALARALRKPICDRARLYFREIGLDYEKLLPPDKASR